MFSSTIRYKLVPTLMLSKSAMNFYGFWIKDFVCGKRARWRSRVLDFFSEFMDKHQKKRVSKPCRCQRRCFKTIAICIVIENIKHIICSIGHYWRSLRIFWVRATNICKVSTACIRNRKTINAHSKVHSLPCKYYPYHNVETFLFR